MTTRRDFLKAGTAAVTTGIVFCSCGLLQSAHAQQPVRQKLPVTVGGKRVKTIDVHAHCHFREAGALLGADAAAAQLPPVNNAVEAFIEIDKRLAAMDAQAINEKLAELCASKPDRFAAFASLTLQAPDLAVQELETAVKKQGLKGAAIGGVVNGVEFSDPKFHPVWAKAEQLGVPLFIHPQGVPELSKRLSGNGWLGNTIGNPLETTIALSHLIFEGTLDRFPGLKVIAAHGGGFLPSYADRSDHACLVGPKGCNPEMKLGKAPTEYLKQIYFDSLIFSPEAIPGRRRSDRARQRLSLSVAVAAGGSYFRLCIAQRRRQGRHPRPHCSKTVRFHGVARPDNQVTEVIAGQKREAPGNPSSRKPVAKLDGYAGRAGAEVEICEAVHIRIPPSGL